MAKRTADASNLKGMSDVEREKLVQLIKERSATGAIGTPSKSAVEFLYSNPNKEKAEDFLLGKKIETIATKQENDGSGRLTSFEEAVGRKSIDLEDQVDTNQQTLNDAIKRQTTMDMMAKMRDDPLFVIKKKEDEARKRLMIANPEKAKLLRLHNLQEMHGKNLENLDNETSASDSDSGDEIYRKYMSIVKNKENPNGPQDSSDEEQRKPKQYGLIHMKEPSEIPSKKRETKRESKSPETKNRYSNDKSRRLTSAEKAAKLKAMQSNASWREETRRENIKRGRDIERMEDEIEAFERKKSGRKENTMDKKPDFVNQMMSRHADDSSVSERVRRNAHTVQRNKGSSEGKFCRR